MLNFNIVSECGDDNIVCLRVDDTYYLGCRVGSYKDIVTSIRKVHNGQAMLDYIAKIDEVSQEVDSIDKSVIVADDNYAIRLASSKGHLEVVKYLVEHGADITADNNYAIGMASSKGHLDIVKYLVEHGADITADNNYAIGMASSKGHLEVVKYLVEHGADITADNNYVVRLASEYEQLEVVKYLISILNSHEVICGSIDTITKALNNNLKNNTLATLEQYFNCLKSLGVTRRTDVIEPDVLSGLLHDNPTHKTIEIYKYIIEVKICDMNTVNKYNEYIYACEINDVDKVASYINNDIIEPTLSHLEIAVANESYSVTELFLNRIHTLKRD